MKKKRGRKAKHPAWNLQVAWWVDRLEKMWGGDRQSLIAALSKATKRNIRPGYLSDAKNFGTDPQSSLKAREIYKFVRASKTIDKVARSGIGFESAKFRIGDPDTFAFEGIDRLRSKLFSRYRLSRLTARETFECERIRLEYLRHWRSFPDQHVEDCASSWSLGRIGELSVVMSAGDWIALVALLFREALLCSHWVYATEIRNALHDLVEERIDRLFGYLADDAQQNVVEPYKRAIFNPCIELPGGKVRELHDRASWIGGVILPAKEIQERREVLALSKRDDWAAKQLATAHANTSWCEHVFDCVPRGQQFGDRLFDPPELPEPNRVFPDGRRISRFVPDERVRAMRQEEGYD